MKKFGVFAIALVLIASLAACRRGNGGETTVPTTTSPTAATQTPTTQPSTAPTILPGIDPTLDTNIPDPSVDTSMPDMTDDGMGGGSRNSMGGF